MAPPPPTGFARAQLVVEGDPSPIECWFNPKEYSVSKANTWKVETVAGSALPAPQFGGGQARELSLDLLFDGADGDKRDVRAVTDRLLKMMEVDPKLGKGTAKNSGRPPIVTFAWGDFVSFEAVATTLSVQYTLFRADGSPIRAEAKLKLVQVRKTVDKSAAPGNAKGQNPTTRGVAGLRAHVVRDGDSLPSIAYAAYGDATRWRPIAQANDIDDPLRLRRGASLAIPVDGE
jgi:Contractile injection system tube protein/LysM domain